jgi:uncharacterized tellurite resistance protein B-like protein
MISKLKQLLRDALGAGQPAGDGGHDLRLATAALLLEMARADREETPRSGVRRGHAGAAFLDRAGAAEALLARADESLRTRCRSTSSPGC